jgi:hypothetical protein
MLMVCRTEAAAGLGGWILESREELEWLEEGAMGAAAVEAVAKGFRKFSPVIDTMKEENAINRIFY